MLNDIEFNDPSANLKPVPIRIIKPAPPKKPLPDMPSESAGPLKLSRELEALTMDTKPVTGYSQHGSEFSTGNTKQAQAPQTNSKLQISVENPENGGSEAEPGKMRSPLLMGASTSKFAPPRARTADAYDSSFLSPIFDTSSDGDDSYKTYSGTTSPFSDTSDINEDITGKISDVDFDAQCTPFIVTPEPYFPPALCPVDEPKPRKLFRVLPLCLGTSTCACHTCSPRAETPDVDHSYLAKECILCTHADFELESDTEANVADSESSSDDDRYFPEIVIDTACRPGDSAQVDDFLSLDISTPDSVQSAAAPIKPPISQKRSTKPCAHRAGKIKSKSASRSQPGRFKKHGDVCSKERDFREEEHPDATQGDKYFAEDVIGEFQGIFEAKGPIAWATYTTELHQDLKLHAKKALLDYMKRDFTAAHLSSRNCHCANCHDDVIAMRFHGALARHHQRVQTMRQLRHEENTAGSTHAHAQGHSTSGGSTTSLDLKQAPQNIGKAPPVKPVPVNPQREKAPEKPSPSMAKRRPASKTSHSGVSSDEPASFGSNSPNAPSFETPLAGNGTGATYAYGAKRFKPLHVPGAEHVV